MKTLVMAATHILDQQGLMKNNYFYKIILKYLTTV